MLIQWEKGSIRLFRKILKKFQGDIEYYWTPSCFNGCLSAALTHCHSNGSVSFAGNSNSDNIMHVKVTKRYVPNISPASSPLRISDQTLTFHVEVLLNYREQYFLNIQTFFRLFLAEFCDVYTTAISVFNSHTRFCHIVTKWQPGFRNPWSLSSCPYFLLLIVAKIFHPDAAFTISEYFFECRW